MIHTATGAENSLLTKVFALTGAALLVSALTAFIVATTPSFMDAMVDRETGSQTWLGWTLLLAPLAMLLLFGRSRWGALGWVDLTRAGGILFMGLIALLVVMVVNLFLGSSALEFIIAGAGVVLFTLLTAYDVQQVKLNGGDAIDGALNLMCLVVGALAVGAVWGGVELLTDDDIRVREPLTPRIELVVEDNVVDTVYVYERP